MIRDVSGSTRQTIEQDCQIVYEYLRQCAAIRSPSEVIQEFEQLFHQGKNKDAQVSKALEKIVFSPSPPQFERFFSCCCYIILDCWLDKPETMLYLPQLLNTFDTIGLAKSYDRRRKQLIQLIKNYQQTQSYLQLRAVIAIINPQTIVSHSLATPIATNEVVSSSSNSDRKTLVNAYLLRYTYLYKYFSPQDAQSDRLTAFMQKLEQDRQKDFEILLSQHIIYRFRLKQLAKMKLLAKGAGKIITKVDNPSLLSEKALRIALQQYIGKIEHNQTILERSQRFLAENELRNTYQVFKQDLYRFLTTNIKPRNSTYQFKPRLAQKLADIFPQSDAKPLNRTLVLQTCRQLFSFLIIDPTVANEPKQFIELITNLGTAQVMMILVKIALICPESTADLEKKIYLVVTHYQLQNIQDARWLIKSLEHLLIAFSIYFGNIDVSIASSMSNNE
ncbi:MAG: hypothetical protein ACFCU7_19915 [Pleurocapsa sp.]